MGQKVNPIAFRLGADPDYRWQSRWFVKEKRYCQLLLEDFALRQFLTKKLKAAGIVKVEIERSINKLKIILLVSRPGVVIGRGGSGLEELKKIICQKVTLPHPEKNVSLEVIEVKETGLQPRLLANQIADGLIKRMPFRRLVQRTMEQATEAGALGIKVVLAGRIGGAEKSRREKFSQGTIPLSTLRAEIDYAAVSALTRSGYIGVKVWIHKK
jgi:small subunit ribosomal protein S3